MPEDADVRQEVLDFAQSFRELAEEVQRFIVGQDRVLEAVITALLAGGHVLLEPLVEALRGPWIGYVTARCELPAGDEQLAQAIRIRPSEE